MATPQVQRKYYVVSVCNYTTSPASNPDQKVQGSFSRTFSQTFTRPRNTLNFDEINITLANMTIEIADIQHTTAFHSITIRDLKVWLNAVERDYKQKAELVRVCVCVDSISSKEEVALHRRAFEQLLAEDTEDW